MVEIETSEVIFESSFGGGSQVKGYLAKPQAESKAAVLVVHDVFGLGAQVRGICNALAEQGYIALAPDLYTREKGPGELPDWNAQLRKLQATPDARVLEDLKGAASYLSSRGASKVALMGFGVGATWSFLLCCDVAGFTGAVLYYPIIVREAGAYKRLPIDILQKLSDDCHVLAFFADGNEFVPVRDAHRFEAEMKKQGKQAEIKIYEQAKEDFANADRKDYYKPDAAADAWNRALEFLGKRLKLVYA